MAVKLTPNRHKILYALLRIGFGHAKAIAAEANMNFHTVQGYLYGQNGMIPLVESGLAERVPGTKGTIRLTRAGKELLVSRVAYYRLDSQLYCRKVDKL